MSLKMLPEAPLVKYLASYWGMVVVGFIYGSISHKICITLIGTFVFSFVFLAEILADCGLLSFPQDS